MPDSTYSDRISSVWKWIATLMAGIVLGGIPIFLTTASNVDAGQVRDIVNTESPYAQDKQLIFYKLDQIQGTLAKQERFQEAQAAVWHDVLCLAEAELIATPASKVSPEEKAKALLFYDRSLLLAHAKPCKTP